MPLYNETTESIAMAIATLERAVYRELIEEAKYKGLIAYLENQKQTYHVTSLHVEQAQNKLDEWEDMVDYRGMSEEDMDKQTEEDNDNLYTAAEELLDDFNQDFEKDDDELLREEEVKVSEWKKQTDEIKAWLNMGEKDRAANHAAACKWVSKWFSERSK